MTTIEYFKLQSKNLHKDFRTQKTYFDPNYGRNLYEYAPKFFDVGALAVDYDIDEDNFSLMNAQHYIAQLAGFSKWTEMVKASPSTLELSKMLFDNMHKVSVIEWEMYISGEENDKGFLFDDEFKLDIFKTVFAEADGHETGGYDYRLPRNNQLTTEKLLNETSKMKTQKIKTKMQIDSLPLAESDQKEFIEVANRKFESILETIETEHPELVRKLWNPEHYIGKVLKPDMLPIDRDYALSLIDAFLIHEVIALADEVDKQM